MISFTALIKKLLALYGSNFFLIVTIAAIQLIWSIALNVIPVSPATALRYPPVIIAASSVIALFTELALVHAFSKLNAGSPASALSSLASALRNFPWFMILSVILLVTILIGLFFLIVPGIIFAIWFMFISTALVVENKRGISAFRRSKFLARGYVLPLFLRAAIVALLLIFISRTASEGFSFIVSSLPQSESVLPVLNALSQIFTAALNGLLAPLMTGTVVILYYEMRRIKNT